MNYSKSAEHPYLWEHSHRRLHVQFPDMLLQQQQRVLRLRGAPAPCGKCPDRVRNPGDVSENLSYRALVLRFKICDISWCERPQRHHEILKIR